MEVYFFLGFGLILAVVSLAFILQIRKDERRSFRQVLTLKNQAWKAQTNPHFIANALTAIRDCYHEQGLEAGDRYLEGFSRLMRAVLTHSGQEFIPFFEETEALELYLKLEKLRRPDLSWQIDDDHIPEDSQIPPLLIQPLVENALQHARPAHQLHIIIAFQHHGSTMSCTVRDNGVGHAPEDPVGSRNSGSGFGSLLIQQRLLAYREWLGTKTAFSMGPVEGGYQSAVSFPVQQSISPSL